MPETVISDNTKKAVAFLKALFPDKRINIVAIDPHSFHVTGLTRSISHPADASMEPSVRRVNPVIEQFIEQHNGKRNIYYSVNTPTDDAPDNKLKKEHIKEINAVWIDADPDKTKDFKAERKRLHKFAEELAQSANPPTVITDSGGGIQAFWLLDKPVPVTEDTRKEYEALSRGLACRYDTDKVQNIDRIMRVPYTWNIPDAKKLKAGRETILARSAKINPRRYSEFNFITPSEADDSTNEIDYSKLDMEQVKQPTPKALLDKLAKLRKTNDKIDDLWTDKIDMKPSRSERDFTLAKELKGEGLSLLETAQIMWIFEHGKGNELTAREIIRCYERSGNDFAAGIAPEEIERIAKQTNPLHALKAEQAKLLDSELVTLDKVNFKNNAIPLIKGLIDRNTTNLFFGPSTGGKSFLMIDMALALAKGDAFWDQYRIPEKSGVLIVVGEGGGGYHKRVEVARRKHEIENLLPSNVPFGFITGYYNMFDDDDLAKKTRKKIVNAVKELEQRSGHKVRLIIYDTMSKMLGKGNENDASAVRIFQSNVERIGIHCDLASVIVHHVGKDEATGARGSYALLADMDAQLQLHVKKKGENRVHYLSTPKQKDHPDDKLTKFKLGIMELDKDQDGDAIDSCFIILQNDSNRDLFPSMSDDLSGNELYAYNALRWYEVLQAEYGDKIIVYDTDIRTKVYIFWYLKNNFDECRGFDFKDVSGFEACLKLQKGGNKAMDAKGQNDLFRQTLKTLQKKKIVRDDDLYQLNQEDRE